MADIFKSMHTDIKYRGLILAASTQFSGHLEAAGNPLRCFRSLINRIKQLKTIISDFQCRTSNLK